MRIPENVISGAEPFELPSDNGGDKAALLIHGLTGTPSEMRYIGEVLNRAGYHVRAPLLPGHGTNIKDLNTTKWGDWFLAAEIDFFALSAHFEDVFVVGLSMGGLVTLKLLIEKAGRIKGAALLATPMRFNDWKARYLLPVVDKSGLKYLIRDIPKVLEDVAKKGEETHICYDRESIMAASSAISLMKNVKKRLGAIETPILIIQSKFDPAVAEKSADIIYDGVSSKIKEKIILEKSYHNIAVDIEKEKVASAVLDFFEGQL